MPQKYRITRARACAGLSVRGRACMFLFPQPPPRALLFHVTSSFHSHGSDYRRAQCRDSSRARSRLSVRLSRAQSALPAPAPLHQSGSVGEDDRESCTICELHLLAQGKEGVNLSFLFQPGRQSSLSTHSILFDLSFFVVQIPSVSLRIFPSCPWFGGNCTVIPNGRGIYCTRGIVSISGSVCLSVFLFFSFLCNHGKHQCGDGREGVRRAWWTLPGDCQ